MAKRVQVILEEREAALFRAHARQESKSLSSWLRDAGRRAIQDKQASRALRDPETLKSFFRRCMEREKGKEPDWDAHKKRISKGYVARSGR